MEGVKKLYGYIEKATSESLSEPDLPTYSLILDLLNSRMDMPKHFVSAISKRLCLVKQPNTLIYSFDLLEFGACHGQISLHAQISVKELTFKLSNLLQSKELSNTEVHGRILQTISCLFALFKPHQDLFPVFFQFYQGIVEKKVHQIPANYVSPYKRTANNKNNDNFLLNQRNLQDIKDKISTINELIQFGGGTGQCDEVMNKMIDDVKKDEKKLLSAIDTDNTNNQNLLSAAIKVNEAIKYIFQIVDNYQSNKKLQGSCSQKPNNQANNQKEKQNGFSNSDLLDGPQPLSNVSNQDKPEKIRNNEPNLIDLTGEQLQNFPINKQEVARQSIRKSLKDILGGGFTNKITLNNVPDENQFRTDVELKQYDNRGVMERITDLTDYLKN